VLARVDGICPTQANFRRSCLSRVTRRNRLAHIRSLPLLSTGNLCGAQFSLSFCSLELPVALIKQLNRSVAAARGSLEAG